MKETTGKYLWKDCETICKFKIPHGGLDIEFMSLLYNSKYNEVTYDFFGYDCQFYEGGYLEKIIFFGEEPYYDEYCNDVIINTPIYSPKELFELCINNISIIKNVDITNYNTAYINWYNTIYNIERVYN